MPTGKKARKQVFSRFAEPRRNVSDRLLRRKTSYVAVLVTVLFCCLSLPISLHSEEPAEEIEVVADDLQYLKDEHKIIAAGNVVVVRGDLELSADRAEVNIETKQAQAEGHVVLRERGKGMLSGREASFDFETSQGSIPDGRFYHFPWYGHGDEMKQEQKKVIKAWNVYITSCDFPHPHYDLKAQEATVYTGDKIVAKNVVFRILEVPVFWWPYLVIPLNYHFGGVKSGYSDEFGAYLLTSKGVAITENVKGRLLFDWYGKRGFGFGAEADYKFERLGTGRLQLYGIMDQNAPNGRADNPFENKNRDDRNRGRVTWKHKARLDPLTTLQLQWYELSDGVFLQDFYEREHRAEVNPQSFATLTRNSSRYSLLGHVEKRTNRFQSVAEKLPEVAFTWLRRPLFGTNFYYTNEEGFLNLNETKAFGPRLRQTVQIYTDHELAYPIRLAKFYSFIPFINFREDIYTDGKAKEEEISRTVFGLGFDSSTRFYREWDYEGKKFGMEFRGIRHVVEPILQYNAIKVATVDPSKVINTGRGDNIDHQDILTFGVENRIQTKRRVGRVDVVSFNAFLDYSFGPGSDLLRTRANKFTETRVEIEVRPYDWFLIRNNSVYSFADSGFDRNNLDLVFEPGRLQLGLGHRYSSNLKTTTAEGRDTDSQLTVDVNYDLNERWDVGGYIRWEANENVLEEWEIRARRDLHDWILDVGFNVRDSDRTDLEHTFNKEVFVELQLKAIPEVSLKTGHRSSFSGPRIGRMYSGVQEGPLPSSLTLTSEAPPV